MEVEQMRVGFMAVFCYLVSCENSREALVIDPAGNEEQIVERISDHGLTLKYIVNTNGHACNTFEVMKSILANRWLHMALTKDNLPPHRAKVLMRYLRLYDSHGLDVEEEIRKKVVDAQTEREMRYALEKYDRSELKEPYRKIFDDNVDKRRS